MRDEALLSWRALGRMERLRLGANFYLTEAALAGVLGAMPRLQASAGGQGGGAGTACSWGREAAHVLAQRPPTRHAWQSLTMPLHSFDAASL